MPFTKDGIRPDIIINPHAIPSRMTIGHLVECIIGKAAAIYGGFADSTAFNNKGSKIKVFGEVLSKVGFHSSGNEILYNGMTGEQIETEIFFGPNYYMRLKHMVKDKINYRALGPRTALTKQPVGGRANDGGLRIGEMERDSVISHGAAEFLRESMMERGDKYKLAICNTTGLVAIYNPAKNIFMSPMADGPLQFFTSLDGKETHIENITKFGRSFSIVNVPYSLKLLIQELQTINIQLRLITEENIKQMENMSYSKNIGKLLFKEDITPMEITQMIKKELDSLRGKPDVYSTPESIVFKTPSPEYATGSPAYQPGEEEMDANSPAYNPLANTPSPIYNPLANTPSPIYNPLANTPSPPYNPNSPAYNPNSPVYEPHSPEEPPPMGGGDGPIRFKPNIENDVLSEQASQYNKGELVHYRGDSMPTRLWVISDVGDRLLTIDAKDDNGLEPMDRTKIVTAADIYRQGQYTNSLPFEEPILSVPGLYNSFDQANYPTMAMRQPITQGMPSGIIFAPQIKVVNGSDFSTEPTTNSDTQLANVANDISSILNSPSGSVASPSESPSGSAMPLPDGPLIVKKL